MAQFGNALKEAHDWFTKIKFLEDQVKSLEKLENFPIIAVSLFLLKSQLIEFRLKQLIFSLDSHIYFSSNSSILKRKIRTPADLDGKNLH